MLPEKIFLSLFNVKSLVFSFKHWELSIITTCLFWQRYSATTTPTGPVPTTM